MLFVIYLPSVATAATAVTVAVPVQDQEDQDDDPDVTIVENVAEAAHIDFRPFTYLEGKRGGPLSLSVSILCGREGSVQKHQDFFFRRPPKREGRVR